MKCRAHRSDGAECQAHALRGATVCRVHGGSVQRVRAAAQRRQGVVAAERAVKRLAAVAEPAQPVDDPLTALAALSGEVLRWKDLLGQHVAELDGLRYTGIAGEQIRGEITLFAKALEQCNTVLATYARLGIDERLARISERQAELVAQVIEHVLTDLDLTDEQAARAPGVVSMRLLELVPRAA